MADNLYLSLWFPNLRMESLEPATVAVLKQFGANGGSPRVFAATAYPVSWSEAPAFQRIYSSGGSDESAVEEGADPVDAAADAFELLHEDFAYEFQIRWQLWEHESGGGLDTKWSREWRWVRVTAFGPEFDGGVYEQEGHIRIDFGSDTEFLQDEVDLDAEAVQRVRQNVQQLVDLTQRIEEKCGISGRLLWTESGDNLAQKLIARLQKVN